MRKLLKDDSDLDLDRTLPNIELVGVILCTAMCSNFMFLDQLLFELSCKNTQTHTDSDE